MEMRLKIGFKANYRPCCCMEGGVCNLRTLELQALTLC